MGSGASLDAAPSGMVGPGTRFFCHSCHHAFIVRSQFNYDNCCPNCQSSFLEQFEGPRPGGFHSHPFEMTDEQTQRLNNAAVMLRLLESQLRGELENLHAAYANQQANQEQREKQKKLTGVMLQKLRRPAVTLDMACDQPSCPICSEDFAIGSKNLELPCSHLFCEPCVMPWLDTKRTCPICRFEISEDVPTIEELERFTDDELQEKLNGFDNYVAPPMDSKQKPKRDLAEELLVFLKEQKEKEDAEIGANSNDTNSDNTNEPSRGGQAQTMSRINGSVNRSAFLLNQQRNIITDAITGGNATMFDRFVSGNETPTMPSNFSQGIGVTDFSRRSSVGGSVGGPGAANRPMLAASISVPDATSAGSPPSSSSASPAHRGTSNAPSSPSPIDERTSYTTGVYDISDRPSNINARGSGNGTSSSGTFRTSSGGTFAVANVGSLGRTLSSSSPGMAPATGSAMLGAGRGSVGSSAGSGSISGSMITAPVRTNSLTHRNSLTSSASNIGGTGSAGSLGSMGSSGGLGSTRSSLARTGSSLTSQQVLRTVEEHGAVNVPADVSAAAMQRAMAIARGETPSNSLVGGDSIDRLSTSSPGIGPSLGSSRNHAGTVSNRGSQSATGSSNPSNSLGSTSRTVSVRSSGHVGTGYSVVTP